MTEHLPDVEPHLQPVQQSNEYTDEDRLKMCEAGLAAMEAGCSLDAAALELGIAPSTLLKWCRANSELEKRYEDQKIVRARALIEHSLHEIQSNPDWKRAEARVRTYMRIAALLNPAEFSERAQVAAGKNQGSAKSVTFTLNFPSPSENRGELTVVQQPEDGELP